MAALNPEDTQTTAAQLLRDAHVSTAWQENDIVWGSPISPEEEEQMVGDAAFSRVADHPAGTGAVGEVGDAAFSRVADHPPATPGPPPATPGPAPATPGPAPPTPPGPPPPTPVPFEGLTLPLHGMIELADGSHQVVDDLSTFRAVACLLNIRLKHAKAAIAATENISVDAVVVPPDYVLPNDAITACHRELREHYLPAIQAAWEQKHQRPFALKSKADPAGCDLRGACPVFLNLHDHFST